MKNKKTLKIAIPTILGAGLVAAVPFALTSCSSKPATPTMDIAETGMTQESFLNFYNTYKSFDTAEERSIDANNIKQLCTNGFDISNEQILSEGSTAKSSLNATNFINALKLLGLQNFKNINVKLISNNGELNQINQFKLPVQISIDFNKTLSSKDNKTAWEYVDNKFNNKIIISKNIMTITFEWTAFSVLIPNLTKSTSEQLLNVISNFTFSSSITNNQNFVVSNSSEPEKYNKLNQIIGLPSEVIKSYTFILSNNNNNMNMVIEFNSGFIPENTNTGDYKVNINSQDASVEFYPMLKKPTFYPGETPEPIIPGYNGSNNAGIIIQNIKVTNTPAK